LGDNRVEAALDNPAGFAGDDRYFAVYDNSPPVPVLLLTADSGSRSALYLRTAIESDQAGYVAEVVDVSLFDPRVLPRYPWIVVDDLGILDDQAASVIRQYVESGGALLAGMGAALTADDVIPVTGNDIGTGDVNRRPVYRVSQIDVSHPVLVDTKGWQSITVRQMLPAAPGDGERVLISLDDGRPLLLEGSIGQGRYLLFTSSLDNQWNDLPIHPVFVSFMVEAARFLSTSDVAERQLTIGDVITLRQAGVSSGQVVDPDGQRVLALADTLHAQSVTTIKKGYYEVYTTSSDLLVAVNIDGRESDLSAMTEEQLAAWRTAAEDTDRGSSATGAETAVAELEEAPPLEVWRWVLLLLLVVVVLESALGNRHLTSKLEAA
jgi:hypothetical protein